MMMIDRIMQLLLAVLLSILAVAAYADEAQLPGGVRSTLNLRQLPHDSLSIYIEDADSGEVVLDWLGNEPRNPASTIKLLTTLVALDVLGPTYRWKTDVYALGEVENGRLQGDLLLKGYGDPFLVTERVWQMQRDIRGAGIEDIDGDLLLDDSWFEVSSYDPAAFDRQPLRAYNVSPNALLMNFKVVRYWFEPDGKSVRVRLDPNLGNLRVDNRLTVRQGYCGGFQRGIAVAMNGSNDEVIFSGRFPSGCELYAMDRTALSHNQFAYGLFRSLWEESGGSLDGSWKNVVAEEEQEPLVTFYSPPLADIITKVNKHSNNVMARQILYTLGAELHGPPGTEGSGREAVADWLQDNGLDSSAIELENGTGLSRQSRITARAMGKLLRHAWKQPYMPEFLASMSLNGLDGTLRRRFGDGELAGKAHLKTGSLDHVTAIAGYLQARSGRRYIIAMQQNYDDVHRGHGREVQEAVLRWLYEL
jgi:D-alanyl-D-alanine carboxypeptidase/D-alanyl-D-alanine-endopeptidase (penicillin-binding protein 4)